MPARLKHIFDHRGEGPGQHLAELRVAKDSRRDTIHGQYLDTELGHTSGVSAVLREVHHVCDVAVPQVLLEVVRLEELDALLGHALA